MAAIMRKLNMISRCEAIYRTEKSSLGIPGIYHSYILCICKNPGENQESLAKMLCINKSSVTRHLTYLENTGAAFGILKNHRWIFLVISTVAIIALITYMLKFPPKNKWLSVGLSFIVGGGIGNMIDRTILGYVVDFIDFRLINFAIFNVADSFVCIGAVMLMYYLIVETVKETKAAKAAKALKAEAEENNGDSDVE